MKLSKIKAIVLIIISVFIVALLNPVKSQAAEFASYYNSRNDWQGVFGLYLAMRNQGSNWLNANSNYFNRIWRY